MVKDYRWLWKDVASASNRDEAVRTLAEILPDKEGRTFISNLERADTGLCIEILDLVSRDPRLLPPAVLDSFARASRGTTSKPQRSRPSLSCWEDLLQPTDDCQNP